MAKQQPRISLYSRASDTDSDQSIDFDFFLEGIRIGKWEDAVSKVRTSKTKEEINAAKKKVPGVTISGKFSKREDSAIDQHSGFISIDIDKCDVNKTKNLLREDPYVVSCFMSVSGKGVCAIFNIVQSKHREAFQGICEYLYSKYEIICDPTSVNVSRLRFVSFDPDIYIADQYIKFTKYPEQKPPKKVDKVIYSKNDFDNILTQIVANKINLCESYYDWIRIGFGIADQFKEEGRSAFHIFSQYSTKYNSDLTDKQYDIIVKRSGFFNEAKISTVYYYCKLAGLEIYSPETKKAAAAALQGKKSGLSKEDVVKNLKQFEGITGVEGVVEQVYLKGIEIKSDDVIENLEMFVRQNYDLKRNELTRYIENSGKPMQQKDLNTIYIAIKKVYPEINYDLMDRLINSDFIPTYNPLLDFFKDNLELKPTGLIEKLFSSIKSKDPAFTLYFGLRWIVSGISAAHGEHSPLMLVLAGEKQNTGKTEFFRRLLPDSLRKYYAESKLDSGKDDEILMTQKWIIMDDEMGGKSKKENKRLKELTSKQTFSLREPYGRNNVDLLRLSLLAGTSNDLGLLNDPTGNRRILPVEVTGVIDREIYNGIDKTELWMEAYHLWRSGFDWKLNDKDIEYLGEDGVSFEAVDLEKELILKYFQKPENKDYTEQITTSELKIYLEDKTRQKLILDRIGKQMKSCGFEQRRTSDGKRRVWIVEKIYKDYAQAQSGPNPF